MRRLWIICLLGLPVFAQQDEEPTSAPFLWCIEGETPSYLFATLDVPDARLLALPDCVEAALAECSALYAELALDIDSQVAMSAKLVMPDEGSLEDVLSRAQLLRVHKMVNEMGFPFEGFKTLRVWAMTMTLPQLDQVRQALQDKDRTQPLDVHVYHRALAANKEVGGLETIEEQIAIFDATPMAAQVKMLEQALEDLNAGKGPRAELMARYLAGDLVRLAALAGSESEDPELVAAREQLMRRRNELLAERIAGRLQQAPARCHFFALGYQHFAGETGLLALLRSAGLTISRVQPTPQETAPE